MDLKPQNLLLHVTASGKFILKVGGMYIRMFRYCIALLSYLLNIILSGYGFIMYMCTEHYSNVYCLP